MRYQKTAAVLGICMLAVATMSMPAGALDCDTHIMRSRPIDLGVSGGNINSFLKHHTVCFSGTLGAEVHDKNGKQFILSNNHVIADINTAKPGELIVQPGLVDTSPACTKTPDDAVATFSRAIKLDLGGGKNKADAAIAAVLPNDVNTTGDILNIGPIASTTVSPALQLGVQKMGSATCVTTGSIASIGLKGTVTYSNGKKAKFIDLFVIDVQDFGNPGDSGSLILTQDACPQAVGLLFAGSADHSQTIANPIGDVLGKLGVSMTGSCSAAATASPQAVAGNAAVSKDLVDSASAVRDRHEDELMKIPGAVGTAIGVSDTAGQPAIEVYIDKMTPEAQSATPKDVEGVPVKLIENGGFVAY